MESISSKLCKKGPCRIFRHAFPSPIIETQVLYVPYIVLIVEHPKINGSWKYREGDQPPADLILWEDTTTDTKYSVCIARDAK